MAYRLFRHQPTGRWMPIIQDAKERTPGEAYLPDLAQRYNVAAADLAVLTTERLPEDFETFRIPPPPPPPKPLPLEHDVLFRATVLTLLDLLNVERAEHSRAAISPAQFVAAVRARL